MRILPLQPTINKRNLVLRNIVSKTEPHQPAGLANVPLRSVSVLGNWLEERSSCRMCSTKIAY
jgi:hypothetical protein